ncbi:MAG: cyclic nucleotide-binding domain-containing protein [Anaerolineae bacterium]|nr:cyclic nucleotide-binding domain-containing protein [Anaerolineae bacterium]
MASKTELKALTMLRSIELTRDMETRHLRKLAAIAQEITFHEGEFIYRQGDKGKGLYLLQEGEVVIEMEVPGQNQVVMNYLGPGDFFGWSSLFPLEHKMAWTRALQSTRALMFEADSLRDACRLDHTLEYAIVRRAGRDMVNRIKATRHYLSRMVSQQIGIGAG